jgi:hypothetical protein
MTQAIAPLPNVDPGETVTVTFDYTGLLATGVTLSGTPTVSATVAPTSPVPDGNPSNILLTEPQLGPSPKTGAADTAVLVQTGSLVVGAVYILQALCTDSNGDTRSLWTHEQSAALS